MNDVNSPWLSEDHRLLQDSVRKFLRTELVPNIQRWRKQRVVDREFWRLAGQAGLLGATMPEEYGGAGGPKSFDALIMLEQARTGDTSWGYGIAPIVSHYILAFGAAEQKARWLPGIASGNLVPAIAMTEPGTGSDLQAVRTTARKDGNHYVINGSKTFITNGQTADLICIVVKTDNDAGARGVSLVMLETDGAEGFRRGRNLEKMGLKGQDTSELFFDDVRVPQTNLLGLEEGQGFFQLMQQLPWERLIVAVAALGACDLAIHETVAYVRERKAFGKRVMDYQNTRFKLAEMKTKLEVTRAFVDQCIADLDAGTLNAVQASMAKLWASETVCQVADECLQLHGGYGYMSEYPISHIYTDARVQRIYGGTNEIMKELIARSLED